MNYFDRPLGNEKPFDCVGTEERNSAVAMNRLRILPMTHTVALAVLICASALGVNTPAHAGPVSIKPDEVGRLRELVAKDPTAGRLFDRLHKTADDALDDKPNPIALIESAGKLASDPAKIRTGESLGDMAKVEALSWTAVVTGEKRYRAKTREFILAWATTNKADGNPINATTLEPVIEAYDITRETFEAKDRAVVDAWVGRIAERIIKKDSKQPQKNWEGHRVKLIGLAALTIGDRELEMVAEQMYKAYLQDNFDSKGESVDFKERDALHYHLYAVRPLLTFACAERRNGDDIYRYTAPNGASLERAVDFVRPFATGEKVHSEFARSTAAFDKKRADAGDAEYKPHAWDPKSSINMFAEAGCLNPSYDKIAATVAGSEESLVSWRSVLNAAQRP